MKRECISAEEHELVSFFEVLPEKPEDEPWPYTDALFTKSYGDIVLACSIAPAYRDVRLSVSHRGQRIYELSALAVHDVRYVDDKRKEFLEIWLSKRNCITMRVKPHLEIRQNTTQDSPAV